MLPFVRNVAYPAAAPANNPSRDVVMAPVAVPAVQSSTTSSLARADVVGPVYAGDTYLGAVVFLLPTPNTTEVLHLHSLLLPVACGRHWKIATSQSIPFCAHAGSR